MSINNAGSTNGSIYQDRELTFIVLQVNSKIDLQNNPSWVIYVWNPTWVIYENKRETYRIIISCNRLIHFKIPVSSIVSNLQQKKEINYALFGTYVLYLFYIQFLTLNRSTAAYPFDKISAVRIRVKCFIALYGGCDLSYNLFTYSIFNRYGTHLKLKLLEIKIFQ